MNEITIIHDSHPGYTFVRRIPLEVTREDLLDVIYKMSSSRTIQLSKMVGGEAENMYPLPSEKPLIGFNPSVDILHVKDLDPQPNTTFSHVDKYVISQEAYDARTDTAGRWISMMKAAHGEKMRQQKAKSRPEPERDMVDHATPSDHVIIGERCEINDGRRGLVKYHGLRENSSAGGGYWVAVQLDEPLGNDLVMNGDSVFSKDEYGTYVRGSMVRCGPQFQPIDPFGSEDAMEF